MRICSAELTDSLLSYSAIAEALERVLGEQLLGHTVAPERLHLPLLANGVLLAMPAADKHYAITKLVTVHPNNAARGLPSVQGDVLVMDAATGERLALLEGGVLTAKRTAALSLLAARLLAPNPQGELLVFGAGVQARAHIEAFAEGLETRSVFVCSRSPTKAEALVLHARNLGLEAEVVIDPRTVLERVRLVVTATTSQTPVLEAGLRPGSFVAAVGAYLPTMAELGPNLVWQAADANTLWVDTLPGAKHEAGDLIQAGVDWGQVRPLEQAIEAQPAGLDLVVFKSVGHALWDLAAAHAAVQALGLSGGA